MRDHTDARGANRRKSIPKNRRHFLKASGAVTSLAFAGFLTQDEDEDEDEDNGIDQRDVWDDENIPPFEAPRTREELQITKPGINIWTDEDTDGGFLAWTASRESYRSFVTPHEDFYVRSRYPTTPYPPDIDLDEHAVTIMGDTVDETSFTVREIIEDYPTVDVGHLMECRGNGGYYTAEENRVTANHTEGWGLISNGIWTGTPLSVLLEEAGVDPAPGRWITGVAGLGEWPGEGTPGVLSPEIEGDYAKSIPMEKAMQDTILTYELNGEPLPQDHGYPIRLLAPGYAGNSHVKYLDELWVMDRMMDAEEDIPRENLGRWHHYHFRVYGADDERFDVPKYEHVNGNFDIWEQMQDPEIEVAYSGFGNQPKALITKPYGLPEGTPGPERAVVGFDDQIQIEGVAYAGQNEVEKVEITDDMGETFIEASLYGPEMGAAWRKFRVWWDPDEPGEYWLAARCTNDKGHTQPGIVSDPEDNLRSVEFNEDSGHYEYPTEGQGMNAYLPDGYEFVVEE